MHFARLLAVAALAMPLSSPAHADQWSAQQTSDLVNTITNALPADTPGRNLGQQAATQYNQYRGYQSQRQIGQGLQNNVLNNLTQMPTQQYVPTQIGDFGNRYTSGQQPALRNDAMGQARTITDQLLPRGVSIDPAQLLQQR